MVQSGPCKEVPAMKTEVLDRKSKMEPPGPDRGWAWVVAFACFTINFILAGLARSSGVLYVALIELYGVSREAATTPFSMRVCVRNLSGPIVGMIGQRYGIRCVTLIGGLLAGLGGILCYFAPDVFWLTLFWGVLNGIGFGFSTVIHMMAINHYFDRYKGAALGLGYSGDCIGTFVLPVVLEFLIATYGVKETFLLIGAVVLNVIPMAMLLRPPSWDTDKAVDKPEETATGIINNGFADTEVSCSILSIDQRKDSGNQVMMKDIPESGIYTISKSSPRTAIPHLPPAFDSSNPSHYNGKTCKEGVKIHCHSHNSNFVLSTIPHPEPVSEIPEIAHQIRTEGLTEIDKQIEDLLPSYDSQMVANTTDNKLVGIPEALKKDNLDKLHKKCDSITEIHFENISRSGSVSNKSSMTATIKDHCNVGETFIKIRTLSETLRNRSESKKSSCSIDKNCPVTSKTTNTSSSIPEAKANRDIIEVSREVMIQNGEQHPVVKISYENEAPCSKNNQINELCLDTRNLVNNGQRAVEITTLHRHDDLPRKDASGFEGFKRSLCGVFRKTYATNKKPIYLLICFTFGAYVLMFVSVITVIIDFALDKGISENNGKYLIIALSAADLAGRLGFGVIIDKGWIEMKNYVALTKGIMGFVIAVMPFMDGFLFLMCGVSFFGFIQGGAAIVYPILIEKYMDKDEQSIAMGCLSFYGGILMFAMAPMIGFFRDNYGTYDGMFYIDGIMTLALGLIWFLEPLILKCQKNCCGTNITQEGK